MKPARLACLGVALVLFSCHAAAGEPPAADLVVLRGKAERGDPFAQYNLGLALTRGATTGAERIEAFVWLTLASENGATDKALETVLDTLSTAQAAEVRRRVDALRAANPSLRAAAAIPVISAPAAGSVPIITMPGGDKALSDQLAAAVKEKSQMATELAAAWKDAEQLKAQLADRSGAANLLAGAQKTIRETQAGLARQSGELTAARAETAAARTEIGKLQTQLATLRDQLTSGSDARTKAETALAAAEQVAVARAEDLGKLRAATTAQELATMRDRATATRELETRVKQLESEKAALATAASAAGANADEFARASKALADTEGKLATALRSYTLLTTERDELRGQIADLAAKLSAAEARAAAAAVVATPPPTPVAVAVTPPAPVMLSAARATAVTPSAPAADTAPSRPTAPTTPGARTHVIAVGDTLSGLSRRYYGTPNRWPEILAANRDLLPDERSLVAGKILRIP